jgi:23S rRNA (adenine2503-C2)-methyltransferase
MWDNVKIIDSQDTNVSKFVFEKGDAVAEAVLYKYNDYNTRTVICCSSQSGCPVGCRFCGAGDYFVRSFTSEEIVSQVDTLLESRSIIASEIQKFQIMFMSMGEPLLNMKNLGPAMETLHAKYPNANLLISTSAPDVPDAYEYLVELSEKICRIGLQFSVHESTDEARDKLIPFKKKLSLQKIAKEGIYWAIATGRRPYFNYCVNEHNNTPEDISRLVSLFDPHMWEATLSVVCERDESIAASNARQRSLVEDFMQKMVDASYSVRMFDPAGQDDIGGGCGQLWFVQDWMKQHPDLAKRSIGNGLPKVHTPTNK